MDVVMRRIDNLQHTSFRADGQTHDLYDLYDLYDLAHVDGWGPYNLHHLARTNSN